MSKSTIPGKIYVLQRTIGSRKAYLTRSKSKTAHLYWGEYIGTACKRFGACRFVGGPDLDASLQLPGNADIVAVEVKK